MNEPKHITREGPQWTFQQVVKQNRQAIILWMALTRIVDQQGHTLVATSRSMLAQESGLETKNHRGISNAIRTLEQAGWITVERPVFTRGPGDLIRLLRIWIMPSSSNMYSGLLANRNAPRAYTTRQPKTAIRLDRPYKQMTTEEIHKKLDGLIQKHNELGALMRSGESQEPLASIAKKREDVCRQVDVFKKLLEEREPSATTAGEPALSQEV